MNNLNQQLEIFKIGAEEKEITISFKVPYDSYRKTKRDYIYFNSDLNKFIGDVLPKIMTSIDCDLLQYKKSKRILRIGEYKHNGEELGYQQNEALKEIARLFKWAMDMGYDRKLECVIIRGNYPFDKLEIIDFIKNNSFIVEGEDVKKYLTFEL